jgi:hypothetical protein
VKAFISYSHDDAEFLTKLHQHLAALRRQNLLETWTDREIDAGGVLDTEISAAMESADLFLLLVSSSFISSDYCYEKEFKVALDKHQAGEARIVPIIIRPCDWKIEELRQFKALPEDGKPVQSKHWHDQDEAFASIAEGLRSLVQGSIKTSISSQIVVEGEQRLTEPQLPFAKELLQMIMQHPNEEEQGLTEILRDNPAGLLFRSYIPNTTASGNAPSVKKSVFAPAVEELVRLGWLQQPEGNHALKIYELNPNARRLSQ